MKNGSRLGLKKNYEPLWIAVRLTQLPLQAQLDRTECPSAVKNNSAQKNSEAAAVVWRHRVCNINSAAVYKGVQLDMPANVAAGLLGKPLYQRDVDAEKNIIKSLCNAYYQITPYLDVRTPKQLPLDYGVLLEISRCLNLFKGFNNIMTKVKGVIQERQLMARYAVGHTAESAWLLTLKDQENFSENQIDDKQIINFSKTLEALKTLPLSSIEAFQQELDQFKKIGFHSIGDLLDHKHNSGFTALKRRFSAELNDYIAELLACDGLLQPSLFKTKPQTFTPEEPFTESIECDTPISHLEWVAELMEKLLYKFSDYLQANQLQCQQFYWHLRDIHNSTQTLEICIERFHSDIQLPLQITEIQLQHKGLEFEVDSIELFCDTFITLNANSHKLAFDQQHNTSTASITLTNEKLTARLGKKSFYKVSCQDSFVPENSYEKIAATEKSTQDIPVQHQLHLRPDWVFDNAQPIRQNNQQLHWQGQLSIISPAERIQTDWWQEPVARDYYIAQRDDSAKLWIYQDLNNQRWFVQGIFN